ncbi:hypothetical protein BD626DRAFT_404560 [Schizophyllum amplum]|uniref:Flavin reductase like domain-containing protein n=1 Tax=Schizophyllum amplum TaxID=97359 RepID=A0A550CB25_9AGAR|nr:hypothetical protein BD626DRAFT_404560 [Auriculariopsis ampla]
MSSQDLPPFRSRTPEFVQPPIPDWKFGTPCTATEEGRKWMEGTDDDDAFKGVDPLTLNTRDLYNVMKSGVIPRPIAFVSTTSDDGIDNIAPFSFFNIMTGHVAFSITKAENMTDTLANVRNGFVVNLINEPWVMNSHAAAIPAPHGVSEWGFSGLTKVPSKFVKAPRVKESAFAMECEYLNQYEIRHPGDGTILYIHVIGQVKYMHLRRSVLNEKGMIDVQKYKPVARMGDISYGTIGNVYRMPAPSWAEVESLIPDDLKKDLTASSSQLRVRRVAVRKSKIVESHLKFSPASATMSNQSLPPFRSRTPEFVQPPHPEWKYGTPVTATEEGKKWMEGTEADDAFKGVDPSTTSPRDLYNVMKSGVVPRPIAFVSTTSADGIDNLAPFSFFNIMTGGVAFSIDGSGSTKDTLANIHNGFVVNLISEPWVVNAHAAAIPAPPGVSEWGFSGLTKAPSKLVKAPRVKESAFAMECEFLHQYEVRHPRDGTLLYTHVLGEVKYIHLRRSLLNEKGALDVQKYKPVARMGDISYGTIGDVYRMPAPSWQDVEPLIPDDLKKDLRETSS